MLVVMDRLEPGGAQINMLRLLERLDRSLFEPVVLLPYGSRLAAWFQSIGIETWLRTIPAWRKGKNWPELPFYAGEMVWEIYRRKIDLVLALDVSEAPGAVIAGWLTARPSVVWFQDSLISARKARKYLLHRAAAVVTVAGHLAEKVRALPARGRVEMIYNGVDPEEFHPGKTSGARIREELNLQDQLVLGMLGRIAGLKGQIYLVEALGVLKAEGIRPKVILAGQAKEDYRREIIRRSGELGVQDQIHFLGFRDEVREILAALDALVVLSENEGLPLGMAEAMSMQCPIIYSPAGGVTELAGEVDIGYQVVRDDPRSIADAINKLADNPQERCRKGLNARQRICQAFDLNHQVKLFSDFLLKL